MTETQSNKTYLPNKEDMTAHIQFLIAGMTDFKDGKIEIAYGDENNNPRFAEKFCIEDVQAIVDFAAQKNAAGRNVYICGSLLVPDVFPVGRCNDDDFYATNSVWCDVDNSGENPITPAELKLKYAACPPNIVVVTGRTPNLRTWLWWKLDEPITDKNALETLLTGIIQNLDGDRAAKNPTRLTRLGGSIAWNTGNKAKSGRVIEIVEVKTLNNSPISYELLLGFYPIKEPIKKPATAKSRLNVSNFNNPTDSEMLGMLSFLSPDCFRQEWLEIGMALHDAGYDFSVWDKWSSGSPSKYDQADTVRVWNSFHAGGGISLGTVVKRCRDAGYMRVSEPKPEQPKQEKKADAPKKPLEGITGDLFSGLLRDTINDIVATSSRPQPELAVLNTLAALGAVFGRRYASPMDTRTNIYTVGVAKTGSGKDHSRKYIKYLMYKANLTSFLGSDSLVSGAGLITAVSKNPSHIMHLDEFGMLLADIQNKNTASHMKVCAKLLTEMYSSSNTVYYGGQYADRNSQPIKVYNPNLCIYGTTTMDSYASAMDRAVIASGELNRYVIIRPENETPERVAVPQRTKPTQAIVDSWEMLAPMFGGNNPEIELDTIRVSWQFQETRIESMLRFQDSKTDANELTSALWARYVENVIKIAMIIAITRDLERPNIGAGDFDVAELIVGRSVEFMCTMANEHMADSAHEKDCNFVLDVLRKFKRKVAKEELCRRTRHMDKRQRDNVLESLEENGSISIEEDKNSLRRKRYFISVL
jgi:hypothetical protein